MGHSQATLLLFHLEPSYLQLAAKHGISYESRKRMVSIRHTFVCDLLEQIGYNVIQSSAAARTNHGVWKRSYWIEQVLGWNTRKPRINNNAYAIFFQPLEGEAKDKGPQLNANLIEGVIYIIEGRLLFEILGVLKKKLNKNKHRKQATIILLIYQLNWTNFV